MEGQGRPNTMNQISSFATTSYSSTHSASSIPQSLPLRPTQSIENFSTLTPDSLNTPSSSAQRSPSYSSLPDSRQSSPAMESRPTRKQTAPGALDLDIPVTYTPTTHRISKAKKGKKVHVCEFGCGKIFTRAEHRKRHEANHKSEPTYKCHVEGCQKPFQRRDLLDRHLERQHQISIGRRVRRGSSVASSVAGSSVRGSPVPALAHSHSPALMGYSNPNTPLIPGPWGRVRALSQPLISNQTPFQMPVSETTRSYTPDFVGEDPQSMYPQGNLYTSDVRHTPLQKPTTLYATEYTQMPMSGPYGNYQQAGVEGLGLDLSGGQFPSHVGHGSSTFVRLESNAAGTSTPPSSTYVSQLSTSNLVDINEETRGHYEVCYWETVDPIFPIIHYGTYIGGRNHAGLRDIVCALGAQASPHGYARKHSAILFDSAMMCCQELPESLHPIQTPLELLQLTFLLEYLALYRWRLPGVFSSPRFAALFNNFLSSHQDLQNKPEFYSLQDSSSTYAGDYHTQWIDLESRRRLLAACHVLDTHRSQLFEQRTVNVYPAAPIVSSSALPSSIDLWTADTARWHALIPTSENSSEMTYFHLSISHSLSLVENYTIALHIPPDLLALSLQLATHTPVRPLLVTAAGSWLFTRKVSETNWLTAKHGLRNWASGQDAIIAAWLAGKVLREYFSRPRGERPAHLQSRPGMVRLEVCWTLYLAALVLWAFTAPASRSPSIALSPPLSAPSTQTHHLPGPSSDLEVVTGDIPRHGQGHYDNNSSVPDPPLMILPSQHALLSPPSHQRSGPSNPGPTSNPSPNLSSSSRRKPRSSKTQQPGPSPLIVFLGRLDTPTWQEVVQLRGASGVAPVLSAVKSVMLEDDPQGMLGQAIVRDMGCLIGEAVAVLGRLERRGSAVF